MSKASRLCPSGARAIFFLAAVLAAPLHALPDPTYAALRGAKPDGRTIPVHNLVLERDAFRFQLDSGALHLLAPVQVEFGKNDVVRIGMLGMTGESTVPIDATLKLPKAPKRALVNAHGEVLARD